jgi:hypothetical protein
VTTRNGMEKENIYKNSMLCLYWKPNGQSSIILLITDNILLPIVQNYNRYICVCVFTYILNFMTELWWMKSKPISWFLMWLSTKRKSSRWGKSEVREVVAAFKMTQADRFGVQWWLRKLLQHFKWKMIDDDWNMW